MGGVCVQKCRSWFVVSLGLGKPVRNKSVSVCEGLQFKRDDPKTFGIALCSVERIHPRVTWPTGGNRSPWVCADLGFVNIFLPFFGPAGQVPPPNRDHLPVELNVDGPPSREPIW